SSAILAADRAIVVEALLVAEELFPIEIAGVRIMMHDRPVGEGHTPGPPLDSRCLMRQCPRACLGPAVDIGAGITGVGQNVQNTAVPQGLPQQFAVPSFAP